MPKKPKVERNKVPKPQERRYSLEELSQRWNRPISEIRECLRQLEFRRVVTVNNPNRGLQRFINHNYLDSTIWPFENCDHHDLHVSPGSVETAILVGNEYLQGGFFPPPQWDVWIPEDEVRRFEQIKNLTAEQQSTPPTHLKLNWIKSEELKASLMAYHELYALGNLDEKKGAKDQIIEWLTKRFPRLSDNQKNRIAQVVNLNKKGGAPPST